jgi:hypothetical protein
MWIVVPNAKNTLRRMTVAVTVSRTRTVLLTKWWNWILTHESENNINANNV